MVVMCHFLLLMVALVQVCKSNLNVSIARGKPTVMSSTFYNLNPARSDRAVDGNTSGGYYTAGCAHTAPGDWQPWWMVDLQMTYLIHSITITNRDELTERLHDFAIEVFSQNPMGCDTASVGVCFTHTGGGLPSGQTTITCDKPIRGRFVRIRKWGLKDRGDALTLCEVEVYNSKENECNNPKSFWRKTRTRLLSENYVLLNGTSLTECSKQCGMTGNCLAFNFNIDSLQCEMISSASFKNIMESRSEWDYYGSDVC